MSRSNGRLVFHQFPVGLAGKKAEAADEGEGGHRMLRVRDEDAAHHALQAGPDERLLPAFKEVFRFRGILQFMDHGFSPAC